MAKFTELHHGYISAMFYKRLMASNAKNTRDIFLRATCEYGGERGRRMALRALRDAQPLDFASYRKYSEWSFTEEYLSTRKGNGGENREENGDLIMEITACPWSDVYLSLGLADGAEDYCLDLDKSIARGFNPALTYDVLKTMHKNGDCCIQIQRDAHMDRDAGEKCPGDKRDFSYHCGHIFTTYSRVLTDIMGVRGMEISSLVLSDFSERFGDDMAGDLLSMTSVDYNRI